jgi:beta-galactosidase GanA
MQLKWNDIEPENGVFDFSGLDKNLSIATAKGYDIVMMVEIVKGKNNNDTTPSWVYDAGVPRVQFKGGGGTENGSGYAPNYPNSKFHRSSCHRSSCHT